MGAHLITDQPRASNSRRFDILSALPEQVITLQALGENPQENATNLQVLRDALAKLRPIDGCEDTPFCGGLIGYLGYESNHHKFKIPRREDSATPQIQMGLYTWAIVVDHLKKCAQLVIHPDCDVELVQPVEQLFEQLPTEKNQPDTKTSFKLLEPFVASQSRENYLVQLRKIIDYLNAGDCYQVNYAQRFSAKYQGDCAEAYLKLRNLTPTPYGAYLGFDGRQVLSLSPERFIQIKGCQVETWPIKGTAPRSANPAEDAQLARQLSDSEKNRAENLMIVDLMRNDLSTCCKPGSIRVPGLYELHSFPTVHHLVSRVIGELKEDTDAFSVLAHCLPGGSITGAPKKRAMEIIAELENQDRGIYCGSIGYLSACGSMDSNIAIRTLQAEGNRLDAWGGGGIVVDSNPEAEYQETLDKIQPLLHHLEK